MRRRGKLSMESILQRDTPIVPSQAVEPHWTCPNCGEPCYCTDELVRRSPHLPCGKQASERIYHD